MFERLSASVDVAFTIHHAREFLATMPKADELGVPSKRGYPLYFASKLPNVARRKRSNAKWLLVQALKRFTPSLTNLAQKAHGQKRDILLPFAQRGGSIATAKSR